MSYKTVNIQLEPLISILKSLDDEAKNEIFERVFIEEDTESLTKEEKESIAKAEREFKKGSTIKWPIDE